MKLFAVTFKDMHQAFRSYFALAFMFGVPILVTGMFYLMFGGLRGENGFKVPQTSVLVVNLDQEVTDDEGKLSSEAIAGLRQAGIDVGSAVNMGAVLIQALQSESLTDILAVSIAEDEFQARQAVEQGQVDVAVIIPASFTHAIMNPEATATLELYQDPTLNLGPGIVKSILDQFVQRISSTKIGIAVTLKQLEDFGIAIDGALAQDIAFSFLESMQVQNQPDSKLFQVTSPSMVEAAERDTFVRLITLIMGGMMVFYAFFTGAASAQSILTEEEKGTLPRLFTTPTSISTILSGKFLAVLIILLVQVSVLLLFSHFVFGIRWGPLLEVILVATGLIVLATTTGLFIISFLNNSRQAGVVFGVVLTFTGMIGIFTVFTSGAPNTAQITDTLSLIVPQGWAMRSLRLVMNGAPLRETITYLAGQLAWSTVFFLVGLIRLRKRFE